MKISKARLKEIIQEEVRLHQNENIQESAEAQIESILNELSDNGVSNEGLKAMLLKVIENIDAGFIGEPS